MAGVDVTACDRSEFFIVGKPLFEVAKAEKLAGKGELVVDRNVFELAVVVVGDQCVFESAEADPDFHRVMFAERQQQKQEQQDKLVKGGDEDQWRKTLLLHEMREALLAEFDSRVKSLTTSTKTGFLSISIILLLFDCIISSIV